MTDVCAPNALSEPDGIRCGPTDKDMYFCYACKTKVRMPRGFGKTAEACPNCGRPVWEYMAKHRIK